MNRLGKKARERSRAGGLARGELHISLSKASFAEFERAFLEYQRKRLREAVTAFEHLEVQRRVAEDILLGAYSRPCTWKDFNRALRPIERLGYTDIGKRVSVASYFTLSIGDFPEQAERARAMLDETERRLRSVRKGHYLREEGMEEIARLRSMTGWTFEQRPPRSSRGPQPNRPPVQRDSKGG